MDHAKIEREIVIDASPATVFDVITSPQHLRAWWPDEAILDATPGAIGELVFGDRSSGTAHVPEITVVDAAPSRLFSFRWVYPDTESAREGNSLLVTFELTPSGDGTLLRMTESGFQDKDWDVAVLEEQYREHTTGWDHFLPRLVAYAPTVAVVR